MPPKSQKTKKNAVSRAKEENEALEALVNAIEGKGLDSVSKKGMTKKQQESLLERNLEKIKGSRPQFTEEQMRNAILAQRRLEQEAILAAQYINEPVPLDPALLEWQEAAPGKFIRYEQFQGTDAEMDFIVDLFTRELTEPYSSFTYQHFVFNWPDLCITAFGVEAAEKPDAATVGEKVGCVVSRVTRKGPKMPLRGYVAMFAVVPNFRGFRLGSRLVTLTAELMRKKGCEQVYLETPASNERALKLYLSLGFVKTKFLPRFYLDHADAYRLVLWLTDSPLTVQDRKEKADKGGKAIEEQQH